MPCLIVIGTQWGDEGKGKLIDLLASRASCIVRSQGGNNAGHTVLVGEAEYKLNLIPSGILYPHTQCYIAAGTVIDPEVLLGEIEGLEKRGISVRGRLWISQAAHLILPYHRLLDKCMEERKGKLAVGTTGRGIGPCYADRVHRVGIRMGDFVHPERFVDQLTALLPLKNEELQKIYQQPPLDLQELLQKYQTFAERLRPLVNDTEAAIFKAVEARETVLLEGANGVCLDITLGTYPYVTASNTVAGGIITGAGLGPKAVDTILGVVKAYTTRVGYGPLPTELPSEENFVDPLKGREIGTTTGRRRRIGWFDAVVVRRAVRLNSIDVLALTKLDILDKLETIKICTEYRLDGQQIDDMPQSIHDLARVEPIYEEVPGWRTSTQDIARYADLPINARRYVERLEEICGVPIPIISVGPERHRTLTRSGAGFLQEVGV